MNFFGRSGAICAIALSLVGCSSAPRPTLTPPPPRVDEGPPAPQPEATFNPAPQPEPEPPPPEPLPPPCYDESYELSIFGSAREYELNYNTQRTPDIGRKAIELFAEYLRCQPDGAYAIYAHLRKARLHCDLGETDRGMEQLEVLSRHPRAGGSEVEEAKYVHDFCQGLVDFNGSPRQ